MKSFIVDAETDARVYAKAEEIFLEARTVLSDDIKLDPLSRGLLMAAAFEIVTAENNVDVALQAASKATELARELSSILNSIMEDNKADKKMLCELLPIGRGVSEIAELDKKIRALRSVQNRKNARPGILRTPVTKDQLVEHKTKFIEGKYLTHGTRTSRGWTKAACIDFGIDAKTLKARMAE